MKKITFSVFVVLVSLAACFLFATSIKQSTPKEVSRPENQSQERPFNPKACIKGSDNNIYLAIREAVFKLRIDENLPLYSINRARQDSKLKFPEPIDRSESEGCLANPLQVYSFQYNGIGTIYAEDYTQSALRYESEFTSLMNGKHKEKGRCEKWPVDSRFTVCHHRDTKIQAVDLHTIYQVDPSIYPTPDGRPFTIYCDDHINLENCKYTYKVGDKFVITVRLHGTGVFRAISDDVERRWTLDSLIVKNYRWASR